MTTNSSDGRTCPSCAKCCSFLLLLGRLCFATLFFLSGVGKLIQFDVVSAYMGSKGMGMIPFFLYTAAVLEIMGAISFILGYKTRSIAMILFLYLIPVTAVFHNFWNLEGAEAAAQMIEFLKNLGIFGGLLYIMSVGAGKFSIDHLCHCHCNHSTKE